MRHLGVVVLFAACGHKAADDAPPAPRPKLELASCGPAREAFSAVEGWGTIGVMGHGAGPRRSGPSSVSIGQPNAQGDLDKAIIRRYIRRNIQKIQYCYEKELIANSSLQGTLQTQFFIDPNGNVTQATGSGVDPKVADCVVAVIKSIEFPKPRGGGGVQVNYPFTFRWAGGMPPSPPAQPDPALARQQAIQQARAAGIIAPLPNPLAQWTPFARMHRELEPIRGPVDDSVAETVRGKLADVDRCFGASPATGVVRAMIDLDTTPTIRVGGLGDAKIEECIAGVLRGATYSATSQHEIACDLVRGGDQTVRVSIGGGYTLVGATKAGVVYDGMPLTQDRVESLVMPKDRVALVVAEPDAPTPVLIDAMRAAVTAPATLVSVHGSGAPVLVGVEPAPRSYPVELWGGGVLRGCANGNMLDERPALTDEKAVAAALATWRTACGAPQCNLRVAVDSFSMAELVSLAAAAREVDVGLLGLAVDHECR